MSTRVNRLVVISALGVAAAAATVSAQMATPAAMPKPAVPAAATAPTENEGEYVQKLRKIRRELNEVKAEVDNDKNQTADENRKDFDHGIREALNAVDNEIVADKAKTKK